MAAAGFEIKFPRRQAMLSVKEPRTMTRGGAIYETMYEEVARVPVFVWPMPTQDGCFIVEHQDGHCQKVLLHELTFLGSKELFDQYSWEEA